MIAGHCGEGVEFTATLADPARSARDRMVFAYRNVQRAIRDGRWKLILYSKADRRQLFDLQSDPHETTNLAGLPGHAAKVAEMKALFEPQRKEAGDQSALETGRAKRTKSH